MAYTDAQLGELLELFQREEGAVSLEQMQALIDWPETPDMIRQQITTRMEERYRDRAAASESLFGRLRSAVWPKR